MSEMHPTMLCGIIAGNLPFALDAATGSQIKHSDELFGSTTLRQAHVSSECGTADRNGRDIAYVQ